MALRVGKGNKNQNQGALEFKITGFPVKPQKSEIKVIATNYMTGKIAEDFTC
jgi:hypothetical protein